MKNMKKAVSFLLVFVMVFAMNFATAFAAEAPENVTVPVEAAEVLTNSDEGIMPLVWHDFTADIPANSSTTVSGFSVPERYMAFESTTTVMNGGTSSGSYNVQVLNYGSYISGHTKPIDGQMYKKDRIDLEGTGNNCSFKIINNSNVPIHVYIVFYSWS